MVGYQKIAIPENSMDIIAAQFQEVGGSTISIQDLVASDDFAADGGDWIRIYDEAHGTYTKAFWWGEDYGVYEDADADEPCAEQGWGDNQQTIMDIDLAPSQGFWVQSVGGGTLLASGEVPASGVVQVPVNSMTLVANPFAAAVDIQDIVASSDFAPDGGDWIRVYDESDGSYTKAFWWGEDYGVYEDADADEPCAEQGWGDNQQTIINLTIGAGQGFWVQSVGGGTLTFPTPTALQ